MAIPREVAWRIFAGELNDSVHEVSSGEERSPSYILTPLGAKVNRVFIVGTLTDLENIGTETEPFWKARVSDPSGVFYISAGQYQPEATQMFSKIKNVPTTVAVIGKVKSYTPEDGANVKYISIRPENIKEVDLDARDCWLLEACKSTKERIDAIEEVQKMTKPSIEEIVSLGFRKSVAEGAVTALERYGKIDIANYNDMLANSLAYLLPGRKTEDITPVPETKKAKKTESAKKIKEETSSEEEMPLEIEKLEPGVIEDDDVGDKMTGAENEVIKKYGDVVFHIIESKDRKGKGAPSNVVIEELKKKKIDEKTISALIDTMLDKGILYEPVLGMLRKV
jgi:RPA family protein